MPIKDRLKELRTAAGLSQQALAFRSGLSISTVVKLEAGHIPNPRVNTLKLLARALGTSLDRLAAMDEDDEPPAAEAEPEPQAGPGRRPRRRKEG
jgi:transcriptional regulator with XRE-family HTH domain